MNEVATCFIYNKQVSRPHIVAQRLYILAQLIIHNSQKNDILCQYINSAIIFGPSLLMKKSHNEKIFLRDRQMSQHLTEALEYKGQQYAFSIHF